MTRATLLFLACCAVACSAASTEPAFGQNVQVRMGASVKIPHDTTTVRFTDVTSDSRCPQGAQCIWAGDAVALFTVGGVIPVTLHTTGSEGAKTTFVANTRLTLVSLAPAPAVGQTLAKGDYVATIRFDSAKD